MIVTPWARRVLEHRRGVSQLIADGFMKVSENGDPLWKFHRGDWCHRHITEVRIGPDRQTLWIKVSDE